MTCIDRTTGSRCPGYPIQTNMNTTSTPGPGAVVGSRIYVTLQPKLGLCPDRAARPVLLGRSRGAAVRVCRCAALRQPARPQCLRPRGRRREGLHGRRRRQALLRRSRHQPAVHGHLDRAAPRSRRHVRHHLPRLARLRVARRRQGGLHRRERRRRVPWLGAPQAAAQRPLECDEPLQRAGPGDRRVHCASGSGVCYADANPGVATQIEWLSMPGSFAYDRRPRPAPGRSWPTATPESPAGIG